MFDIGWTEILIVMGIAIIVVGPKELPKVLRTVGKWRGKASAYARDFQRSIEEAADYSELDAVKKEIEEANRELKEAKSKIGDQVAEIKGDMDRATNDTTILKVDSDGNVSEPPESSPGKPGGSQETGANA
jgi:sec-independent protein translocase protein TatB